MSWKGTTAKLPSSNEKTKREGILLLVVVVVVVVVVMAVAWRWFFFLLFQRFSPSFYTLAPPTR